MREKKKSVRKLFRLFPVLLGLSILAFALMYLSPGDPAQKRLTAQGVAVTREVLETTREEMGLNDPFWIQYFRWLGGVIRGDLGKSFRDGFNVSEKLLSAGGKTLVLTGVSLGLSLLLAIPLGVLSAVKKGKLWDRLLSVFSFLGNSIPNFLLAALLLYVFCVRLKWLPVLAKDTFQGLLLPVLSLTLPQTAALTRQVRAELLEQFEKAYGKGAAVRGVKSRYHLGAALYNALPTLLAAVALSAGTLLGGSVVVETMFSWPGLGKLAMDAISARDYPVVQGFVLFTGTAYVLLNLGADLLAEKLDPRGREA